MRLTLHAGLALDAICPLHTSLTFDAIRPFDASLPFDTVRSLDTCLAFGPLRSLCALHGRPLLTLCALGTLRTPLTALGGLRALAIAAALNVSGLATAFAVGPGGRRG
jgi:hypothetical protein